MAQIGIVRAGAPIVAQGEPITAIALIGQGRARLQRSVEGGHVVPLGYRSSGDLIGEAGLGDALLFSESAVALEETEVVRIPVAAMRGFLQTEPTLLASLLQLFSARQRQTEDRVESLLFRDVEGRLAEFLLQAADRWGVPDPKGTLISAPITHAEIAQAIGSTRETVTITLGALRRDGILDVAGRRLIVVDRDGLSRRR